MSTKFYLLFFPANNMSNFSVSLATIWGDVAGFGEVNSEQE